MNAKKRWVSFVVCFLGILLFGVCGSAAIAATFYVDYENGSDSNDGMSISTPWGHCPGDSNATANADDCSGWTVGTSLYLGPFWNWDANSQAGRGALTNCAQSKQLMCCGGSR